MLFKLTTERVSQHQREHHSTHTSNPFLCSVCESDHYDLVLYAHALSRRSGLAVRCRTCHASTTLFEDALDTV